MTYLFYAFVLDYSMPCPKNYEDETTDVEPDVVFADPLVHAAFTMSPDLLDKFMYQ